MPDKVGINYSSSSNKPKLFLSFWEDKVRRCPFVVDVGIGKAGADTKVLPPSIPEVAHMNRGPEGSCSHAHLSFRRSCNYFAAFMHISSKLTCRLEEVSVPSFTVFLEDNHQGTAIVRVILTV